MGAAGERPQVVGQAASGLEQWTREARSVVGAQVRMDVVGVQARRPHPGEPLPGAFDDALAPRDRHAAHALGELVDLGLYGPGDIKTARSTVVRARDADLGASSPDEAGDRDVEIAVGGAGVWVH